MLILKEFLSSLNLLFFEKSIMKYFFFAFLLFLKLFPKNQYHLKTSLSFYFEKGVQIGLFLSFSIKSITSETNSLFFKSFDKLFKLSVKFSLLKISL